MEIKYKYAYTLAEVIVTLAILGIVAAITIPAIIKKQMETQNKVRVKKAMTVYDKVMNTIIIENELRSEDATISWEEENCSNASKYFKKVSANGCVFKTSDGIWWDIADITRPVIAFKRDNLDTRKANDPNDKNAFVLVARFDNNGALRVDDLAHEKNNDFNHSYAQVSKLYDLIQGNGLCGESCKFERNLFSTPCTEACTVTNINAHTKKSKNCNACTYSYTSGNSNYKKIYDSNGYLLYYNLISSTSNSEHYYNVEDQTHTINNQYNSNINNYSKIDTLVKYDVDDNNKAVTNIIERTYFYKDGTVKKVTINNNEKYTKTITYDSSGNETSIVCTSRGSGTVTEIECPAE